MSKEREDMEAPEFVTKSLTYNEQRTVYRALVDGVSESKLAVYYETTLTEIRAVKLIGKDKEWK
jgi:hypothetical protein